MAKASNYLLSVFIICALLCLFPGPASPARIKDLASMHGVRSNQLIGYGLVVGLNGTGDKGGTAFTIQGMSNMLNRMGVRVTPAELKVKNVAAVVVTAELPPFARQGSRIDVLLSSLGDATSLMGGTLLMTPLKGLDGQIYVISQGPVSIGGFSAGGQGASLTKNHPTVGKIPGGGMVERELDYNFQDLRSMTVNLKNPDFSTADRMVKAINLNLPGLRARALDPATVEVDLPYGNSNDMVGLMAQVENLDIETERTAKVIIEERTGTVIIGENVRIKTVAIASGPLTITVVEDPQVSQALPFAPGGETTVTPSTQINALEIKRALAVMPQGNTIADVVRALNSLGATPRDLIVILQALKAAGALEAELEII
ncbi:MAG: flagellar basal body P-ring protein FlgI [Desulfarculales bacterium]|jgi:flagellar P-ring protein precursor FlgI|nr:flagellar basal body P-ring protein FlgI [Desulfarculales bacterium]